MTRLVAGILMVLASTCLAQAQSIEESPDLIRGGQPPQKQIPEPPQTATPDQRGTEQSPLVVKVVPTPKSPTEAADQRGTEQLPVVVKVVPAVTSPSERAEERRDRDDRSSANWWLARLTGVLGLIGSLQLAVFGLQARRLRQTVRTMSEIAAAQTRDMHASIVESSRAAKAMERVADGVGKNVETALAMAQTQRAFWQTQMRAYVSVVIGTALYQERERGLKFEGKPLIVNTGHTPAHNIGYRTRAAILPVALPENFPFPLPQEITGAAVLGPQQNFGIGAAVKEFCRDDIVEIVKAGLDRALHVWGVITYDDIFGARHQTRFWQIMRWSPDGIISGSYGPRHNDAT